MRKLRKWLLVILILLAIGFAFAWWQVKEERNGLSSTIERLEKLRGDRSDTLEALRKRLKANHLLREGELEQSNSIYKKLYQSGAIDSLEWMRHKQMADSIVVEHRKDELRSALYNRRIEELKDSIAISKRINQMLTVSKGDLLESNFQLRDSLRSVRVQWQRELEGKNRKLDSLQKNQRVLLIFENHRDKRVVYLGEEQDSVAQGYGIGIWPSGGVYKGDWREGKRHGEGVFEWPDGERYNGEYREGYREGQGVYSWPSGEKYRGEWKRDVRNGQGTLFNSFGNISYKGEWKNDQPVDN